MGFDNTSLNKQLDYLWKNENNVKTLSTKNKKYVILSDMHMGNGGKSDDFKDNEAATVRALKHYKRNRYKLILLGDIEELWQFSADEIVNRYDKTVYKAIRDFKDGNVFRVFGNHDIDWKTPDPIRNKRSNEVYEAIKLLDINERAKILLVHGHQGTSASDKFSAYSRGFVRFYRDVEPYLELDKNTASPRSPILDNYEKDRYRWAKRNKLIIICGHSHNAVFCSTSNINKIRQKLEKENKKLSKTADINKRGIIKREIKKLEDQIIDEALVKRNISLGVKNPAPNYFNTGCAIYTDGITVIEIEHDTIRLVKWHRKPEGRQYFTIYEEGRLSEYINQILS